MINKVILVGNVGMDPEIRTMENGTKVARLRIATTERYMDRQTNQPKELTEWHTVTLWRGLADVVDRFIRKGSQVYIEGRLQTREWMDKENNKRYTTEVIANEMKMLGRRSDNNGGGQNEGGYNAPQQPSAAPSYGQNQGGYNTQSTPQPQYHTPPTQPTAAPAMPAEDPDDLPF